ncbi:uncharacterized protein LOC135462886 [Liolophura sinensis]|uniref:uncharacterized protein LOC135462886 n=1 Tax=Liolophura sinensis TaxID=3198878 RepID=UPI003158978C
MTRINCCVPNCHATSQRNFYVKFHKIPRCPVTRKLWLQRARYPKQTISRWTSVCSLHFKGGSKTYLVDKPSIFPWTPEWTDVVTMCNQQMLAWFEGQARGDHRYARRPPLLTIKTGYPSLLVSQETSGLKESIDCQPRVWPIGITENVHAQDEPQQGPSYLQENLSICSEFQKWPSLTTEGAVHQDESQQGPSCSKENLSSPSEFQMWPSLKSKGVVDQDESQVWPFVKTESVDLTYEPLPFHVIKRESLDLTKEPHVWPVVKKEDVDLTNEPHVWPFAKTESFDFTNEPQVWPVVKTESYDLTNEPQVWPVVKTESVDLIVKPQEWPTAETESVDLTNKPHVWPIAKTESFDLTNEPKVWPVVKIESVDLTNEPHVWPITKTESFDHTNEPKVWPVVKTESFDLTNEPQIWPVVKTESVDLTVKPQEWPAAETESVDLTNEPHVWPIVKTENVEHTYKAQVWPTAKTDTVYIPDVFKQTSSHIGKTVSTQSAEEINGQNLRESSGLKITGLFISGSRAQADGVMSQQCEENTNTSVTATDGGRCLLADFANPRSSTTKKQKRKMDITKSSSISLWNSSNAVADDGSQSAETCERQSSPGCELLITVVKDSSQNDEICKGALSATGDSTTQDSGGKNETRGESFFTFRSSLPATVEGQDDASSQKEYRCKFCEKVLPHRSVLSLNKTLSCGKVILSHYSCEKCSRYFVGNQSKEEFFRGGKLPLDGKAFGKSEGFRRIRRQRSFIYTKLYICEVCKDGFATPTRLRQHLPVHAAKSFRCELCRVSFESRSGLKTHRAHAHTEKPFACKTCPKKFTTQTELDGHSVTHTAEWFKLLAEVKQQEHPVAHLPDKPYVCNICNDRFSRQYERFTHERNHTGVDVGKTKIKIK